MDQALASRAPGELTGIFGVLELGTNSLKLHRYDPKTRRRETSKVEWEVGFEIYSSGRVSHETAEHIIGEVGSLLDTHGLERRDDLFGIATGAFREAKNAETGNTAELLRRLEAELSLAVRVLTGNEEAYLHMLGFQDHLRGQGQEPAPRPTMLFDLGGGGLEVVYMRSGRGYLHETLPLGVIRIQQLASLDSGHYDEETAARWIREQLRNVNNLVRTEVYGTGGTVKAMAQVAGTDRITLDAVDTICRETRLHGAPDSLSPRRRSVFLTGVTVVEHTLRHVGAEVLQHHPVGLGEVLMEHLKPRYKALGGRLRRAFLDQELKRIF